MYLYEVKDPDHRGIYWAKDYTDARQQFYQDLECEPDEVEVERVWAGNRDENLRGYIYKEMEDE